MLGGISLQNSFNKIVWKYVMHPSRDIDLIEQAVGHINLVIIITGWIYILTCYDEDET